MLVKPYVEDILPHQDAKKIWMPILTLEYTNRHTDTSDEYATVRAHGTFPMINSNDFSQMKETIYYKGFDTYLRSRAIYHQIFSCRFDVAMFPFDSHCCSVILRLRKSQEEFVQLRPKQSWNLDSNLYSVGT